MQYDVPKDAPSTLALR